MIGLSTRLIPRCAKPSGGNSGGKILAGQPRWQGVKERSVLFTLY